MPTTYEKADVETMALVNEVRRKYHPHLNDAAVDVGVMMAYNSRGPAVTLGGVPCAAVVRVVGLELRSAGLPDALVTIDATRWGDSTEERRRALVDHELYHLVLTHGSGGAKRDDLGRPKLKMKPHDFQVGWFHAIAERHGPASYEVAQAQVLIEKHRQTYFDWQPPAERAAEPPPVPPLFPAGPVAGADLAAVIVKNGATVTMKAGDGPGHTIDPAAAAEILIKTGRRTKLDVLLDDYRPPQPVGPVAVGRLDATTAAEHPDADPDADPDVDPALVPSPADVGLTVAQLEASRGMSSPDGSVGAKLQDEWQSRIGVPVRLPEQPGQYAGYAVVLTRMSTVSITYRLWPLSVPDPASPGMTWGKKRSGKTHREDAPEDVPLNRVSCTAADGTPYVFGHEFDVRCIVATRGEWMDWAAVQQGAQDVAHQARTSQPRPAAAPTPPPRKRRRAALGGA